MAKEKMKKPAKRPAQTAKATAKRTPKKPPAKKKPPTHTRRPNPNRPAILAEMNKTGATAQAMAKKYGVSAWTIYGWRKKTGGKRGRPGRKPGRPRGTPMAGGVSTVALREEIRQALPGILREELARAIKNVFGLKFRLLKGAAKRIRRRA